MKGNITMKGNTGLKGMIVALACGALLLSSCEEFQPVFTGKYKTPETYTPFDPSEVTGKVLTIKELSQRFMEVAAENGKTASLTTWCWEVDEDIWVRGRVTTSDKSGNFYKSFYIQDDENGPGIEVKIGRTSLYNDYKLGQEVYVSLEGLSVGEYGWKTHTVSSSYASGGQGTIQIGLKDPVEEGSETQEKKYSTAYIESQFIINQHIFRCSPEDLKPIEPRVITKLPRYDECQSSNDNVGALVTVKGLKYGDEIFALLYINGNEDNTASKNRIFLSDKTWGITTLAMSKNKFLEYVDSGIWDSAVVGNSGDLTGQTLADVKDQLRNNANAYAVSQYFKPTDDSMYPDGLEAIEKKECAVQIRTSGYSKFADLEIDPGILSGSKTITATGILTMYQGSVQLVLRDQNDIVVE